MTYQASAIASSNLNVGSWQSVEDFQRVNTQNAVATDLAFMQSM